MTWTTTAPAACGYYWYRASNTKPRVVRVGEWPAGELVVSASWEQDAWGSGFIMEVGKLKGEWAGPLLPPE